MSRDNTVPFKLRTDILVIVLASMVCIVTGVVILRQNQQFRQLIAGPPSTLQKGARLNQLNGYHWNVHPATLVIALKAGCRFCEASMPLYREIAALHKNGKLIANPVILFPDGADVANLEGLDVQRLTNVDYVSIGVRSTPTVLLVDSRGILRQKWTGQIPVEQETQFLTGLRHP